MRAIPVLALAVGLLSCAGKPEPGPSGRVFLIGVDGAAWNVMDPLLEQGRLPNFASLIDEGFRSSLGSMLPSRSPALWTTVVTGKEFDKHGINDFTTVIREDGVESARVMHMTSNMRRTKALWNIFDENTGGSAFVGWWVSWPAERVHGYMVTSHVPLEQTGGKAAPTKGSLLPEDPGGQTWPPELFEELAPMIRPAESITLEEARRFMDIDEEELDKNIVQGFRWAYAADETYRGVTKHILDVAPDLDLYGFYFNGVDVIEHRYWKYLEPESYRPYPPEERPRFRQVIERYYEYTDELIGEIVARRRPGDTFLVVSDHGFHAKGHKDGPDGILIAAGANVEKDADPDSAELVDITPTILALLGYPAAEDMDGRVLDEVFETGWRERYPSRRVKSYDTERWREQAPIADAGVDAELLARLKALGYIE